MSEQKDGSYPRVNGGMIQTQQYTGMIVSVVGKMIGQDTLETADGTKIALSCEYLQDPLVVSPDMPVEIIGNVVDATSVTVSCNYLFWVRNETIKLGLTERLPLPRFTRPLLQENSPPIWT